MTQHSEIVPKFSSGTPVGVPCRRGRNSQRGHQGPGAGRKRQAGWWYLAAKALCTLVMEAASPTSCTNLEP